MDCTLSCMCGSHPTADLWPDVDCFFTALPRTCAHACACVQLCLGVANSHVLVCFLLTAADCVVLKDVIKKTHQPRPEGA